MNEDLDFLVIAIAQGDVHAFSRWLASAEAPLRASLVRFATVVDTEAVLQEAMLRIWSVASRFEPDGRPHGLFRLAVRIARNLAISELRRTRATPVPSEMLAEEPEPAAWAPPDPMLQKVLRNCHQALPDKPKEALGARLASQGAEPDEVLAHRLQMRLNTFLQNITRARRLLAACLSKHGVHVDPELSS